MNAPGTFSHPQFRTDVYIQHYNYNRLKDIIYRSYESQIARKIIAPFLENQTEDFSEQIQEISKETVKNIDDALGGRRPDLAPAIWKNILEHCRRHRFKISKLDIDLIESAQVDVGATILIAQMAYLARPYNNIAITLINHDGSKRFTVNKYDNVFQVDMYHMGNSALWCQPCISIKNIPDTAVSAMDGKQLRTLVSHPLLDTLNLEITSVDQMNNGSSSTLIETNYNPRYVLISAMAQRKLEELDAA